MDWSRVKSIVEQPLVLDGRNLLKADAMSQLGFRYVSVGRPSASPGREAAHKVAASKEVSVLR
jgi:UDPglucose 6-dehydrogenase